MTVHQDPLHPFYKQARNRLRKCEPGSMVLRIFEALRQVEIKKVDAMRSYQPWSLLLVLQWVFQEADDLAHRRRPASQNDLHAVLNILHDMDGHVRMPSEFEDVKLFMRQLALQQFPMQREHDSWALARQELLFAGLPQEHPFQREFLRLTGVAITDFLALCFGLISQVLKRERVEFVEEAHFALAEKAYPPGAVRAVLAHLSRTTRDFKEWLSSDEVTAVSISDQRLLPPLFLNRPLIDLGKGRYAVIFAPLVMRCIEAVVYRTLRRHDPDWFGPRFGPLFEAHVAACLRSAGLDFKSEARLQALLPGEGKCVDFLVQEPDADILIDAKGVEVSRLGRLAVSVDAVLRATKDATAKAINQGQETAKRIASAPAASGLPREGVERFILIVTYDDLMLGTGRSFEGTFGGRLTPDLERKHGAPLPVPLANVSLFAVDEFELLMARVRAGNTTIAGAIRQAYQRDGVLETRRMFMRQHLAELWLDEPKLPLLDEALEGAFNRLLVVLTAGNVEEAKT